MGRYKAGNKYTVHVGVDEALLERLDEIREANGLSLSALMRMILKEYIQELDSKLVSEETYI